ncbi:hypothetical protein [Croceimicrobium hydrocarbonivorans]|uniref:Uncharacterized protein n=1 Tax=Croceimicrobium hydrocarbonivorans TaxID=2761580 RepID=A0A7H0VIF1_9FLAO|nr:hypothetical protein [Croceimicrobium hydrocarbonivorans]QNR25499.1 hypothetical protein H4K34_06570 [Croceimicrobium hydrocarbonivorans]
MNKILIIIVIIISFNGISWCQVSEDVAEEIYGAIEVRATIEYFEVNPQNYFWVNSFRHYVQPFLNREYSAIRFSARPFDSIKVTCQTGEDEYIRFYKYWIYPKKDTVTGGRWIIPGSLRLKGFEKGVIGLKCDGQVDLVSGYFFAPDLYYFKFDYWEKNHGGELDELVRIYFYHLQPSGIEVSRDKIEFDSDLNGDHYTYEVLDNTVIN